MNFNKQLSRTTFYSKYMKTITFLYKETEQSKMDGVTCVVIILLRYLVVDDGIGDAAGGVVVSAKLFPPT